MALTQRDRRALLLGGAGIVVLGLYMWVIEPAATAYATMVGTHGQRAERAARLAWEAERARYMDERVTEFEANAGSLGTPKSYSEQITSVSEQLVGAAQAGGAQVRNSTWSAPAPWAEDPSLALARLLIDAEADWEGVFKFLNAVYRIPGVLSVEELDLNSDPKKGGKVAIRLTISVLVQASSQGAGLWVR